MIRPTASARRTNLGLLAFLAFAFVTGAAAFGIGTGWVRLPVVAHGISGVGVIALTPWKSLIARRGLRRRPPGWSREGRASLGALVLTVLVAAAVLAGVAHSMGATLAGPLTPMQVHVGAALAALPFALWHVRARPAPLRGSDLSRRRLLRAGVVLGAAAVGWAGLELALRAASLPGGRRRATGSHERGSFDAAAMPVTQWLDDPVPEVDPAVWRLTVRTPLGTREWELEHLVADERVSAVIDCTGGWHATQEWGGVPLRRLVGEVEARSVLVRSVTGYTRRFPGRDLDRLLLATHAGGEPLSAGHGYPARLVAPGRRGFWWVKWVESIELSARPWWWQLPFPMT